MSTTKNLKDCIIDESWEKTPDMGEYLDNDLILDMAEQMANGEVGGEYFIENPFSEVLGYHKSENAFVISGKPKTVIDGDTIKLDYDTIQDGGEPFVFIGDDTAYDSVKQYIYQTTNLTSTSNKLTLRLVGINAPEVPHCIVSYVPKDVETYFAKYENFTELNNSSIQLYSNRECTKKSNVVSLSNCSLLYYNPTDIDCSNAYDVNFNVGSERNNNDVIEFVKIEGEDEEDTSYCEIIKKDIDSKIEFDGEDLDLPKYLICLIYSPDDKKDMEYHKQAIKAKKIVEDLINTAKDVLVVIDGTSFKHQKGEVPFKYRDESQKLSDNPLYAFDVFFKGLTGKDISYTRLGYRFFGQDYNGRNLGAIYVKQTIENYGDVWINVAKKVAYECSLTETNPAYTSSPSNESNFNYNSQALKMWTYNKDAQVYIDTFNDFYGEYGGDDRDKIQKELTNTDMSYLKEYTVMIGDCMLVVPPTSIRLVSQTLSQRTSLLRAKGAITKSIPKNERIIEMQLYFNGEDAINGFPYEQKTPNGETLIYYMNGLRALIAQFKFTPYLPITNDYINHVLNIEAVTLNSIQINTVPNFPKTIQATIKLQEFDYRQFLPEILPPDVNDKNEITDNMFSKIIHFPVMRYYYQRAIQRGEDVSLLTYNSDPYLEATLGQKTVLQPMKFETPLIDFYIANEEHLKQRLQLKEALEKKPFETVVTYTKEEDKFLGCIAKIYTAAIQTLYNKQKYFIDFNNSYNAETEYYTPINTNTDGVVINDTPFDVYKDLSFGYVGAIGKQLNVGFNSDDYSANDFYNKYLEPFKKEMDSFFNPNNNVDYSIIKNYDYVCREYQIQKSTRIIMYGLKLDIDWTKGGPNLLSKIKQDYGKIFSIDTDYLLRDGCITIGFSFQVQEGDKDYKFKMTEPLTIVTPISNTSTDYNCINADISLLGRIANDKGLVYDSDGNELSNSDIEGDDIYSQNQQLADMKDNIDLETDKSMVFDLYPIGNPIIESVSIVYNNNFNKMSLTAMDGYVSQYIGASDTILEINMKSRDTETVNLLQSLPRICTDRIISYRKIMTCSPLRIDCEIARMFGVNEVVVESVDINTVPNYPGLFDISLRLVSVDRTLRNREALKKLDVDNSSYNNDSEMLGKNFFDLKDTLAKVELYPDLELPTIQELEELGFFFIRYKNQSNRIFPDADFYFVYLYAYTSSMIRKSLVEFFSNHANKGLTQTVSDNMGGPGLIAKINLSEDAEKLIDVDANSLEAFNQYSEATQKLYDSIEEALSNSSNMDAGTFDIVNDNIKDNLDKSQIMLELQENLDSFNYSSYDFNPQIKLSVKDEIPFTKYGHIINKGQVKVLNDKGDLVDSETDDIISTTKETLNQLIKNALKTPIPTGKIKSNDYLTKEIDLVLDYIVSSIVKSPRTSYGINSSLWDKDKNGASHDYIIKNDFKDFIKNKLRVAISSALTGSSSILDYDKSTRKDKKDEWFGKSTVNHVNTIGSQKEDLNILTTTDGQGMSDYVLLDFRNQNYNESDEEYEAYKLKTMKEHGLVYGPFAIKKYNASYLNRIYNTSLQNASYGFIDPLYNKDLYKVFFGEDVPDNIDSQIDDYIKGISSEEWDDSENLKSGVCHYSTVAMYRIILVWLYKLLNEENDCFLPTSCYILRNLREILYDTYENDDDEKDKQLKEILKHVSGSSTSLSKKVSKWFSNTKNSLVNMVSSDEDGRTQRAIEQEQSEISYELDNELDEMIQSIKEGLLQEDVKVLCGLFTTLGALAIGGFDTPIYSAILSGDLASISTYAEKIKASYISYEGLSGTENIMRRYFSYLDLETYDNNSTWKNYTDPLRKYSTASKNERIYLKAAETPSIYLLHSFYDMVMHDTRGRMARAYPTYYMLLVDEGRNLGMWHLQDNFYDVSSISEFQVVKSRKIAADTANIIMTNLFGTFTSEDEDMKDEYVYTMRDAWNSLFSPRDFYTKEYNRRTNAREFNRAKIKPGARVHLRMGYEADASRLPILFNGCVAEVQTQGDMIDIICQGDGVELANPNMFSPADFDDIADLKYTDSMFGGIYNKFDQDCTPRELLTLPLTSSGSWIRDLVKNWSNSRFFNDNPFGIVHFGNKYYNDIFSEGEIVQNIYEGINKPSWSKGGKSSFNESLWELESAPSIKVGKLNKSYWDIMHIAASVSPEFICAVTPFQLRSSIFFGAPRYYCAYDYEKTSSGKVVEKRKPFQQFHIYSSYTDIIGNNITASDKNVKTCAVGMYTGPDWLTSSTQQVGPMWVDIDIYPEYQKMQTVNCDFQYVNTNLPFTIPVVDKVMDKWNSTSSKIAWRATATSLKNSIKDMYTGELIVMGDPTVKPYDKMMIYDTYSNMQGLCDIEATVQTFSVDTGYTTSITPDCTAAIDDKYEKVAHSTMREVLLPYCIDFAVVATLSNRFSKVTRSLYLAAASSTKKGVEYADKIYNGISKLFTDEDTAILSKYSDEALNKLGYAFGTTPTDINIYNSISKIESAYKKVSKISHKFTSGKDITSMLKDLEGQTALLNSLDPSSLKAQLVEAKKATKSTSKQKMLQDAIDELNKFSTSFANASKTGVYINASEIQTILKEADKLKDVADIAESIEYVKKISNAKLVSGADNFTEAISHLTKITDKIDDLSIASKDLLTVLNTIEARTFTTTASAVGDIDKMMDTLKNVNVIKKGAGSIKAVVASNILFLAAQIIITKFAQEYIERKLKNLQVLTVFPLIKNNLVFTAGLNGNMGSVYESPTYNEEGFIEKMAINFFDGKYSKYGLYPIILDCLIDTSEMKKTVDGYRRDSAYAFTESSSSDVQLQELNGKLLLNIAKDEAYNVDTYKQLFLKPRISDPTSQAGRVAYKNSCFINIDNIENESRIDKELVYIFSDDYLKKFNSEEADRRVVLFAAQQQVDSKDSNGNKISTTDVSIKSSISSEDDIVVKAKKIEKDKYTIYDIPYLRADAYIVMNKIVRDIINAIQPDADSGNSTLSELHKHNIIIHNCTRVNDKTSWFNTGYLFTIEVKDYDNFGNILEKLYSEQQVVFNSNNEPARLWNFQKDKTMGDNTFRIGISPSE